MGPWGEKFLEFWAKHSKQNLTEHFECKLVATLKFVSTVFKPVILLFVQFYSWLKLIFISYLRI